MAPRCALLMRAAADTAAPLTPRLRLRRRAEIPAESFRSVTPLFSNRPFQRLFPFPQGKGEGVKFFLAPAPRISGSATGVGFANLHPGVDQIVGLVRLEASILHRGEDFEDRGLAIQFFGGALAPGRARTLAG